MVHFDLSEMEVNKVNKLSLNVEKTHFTVFTNKRKTCHQLKIVMEGEVLQEVSSTKFLGAIIDKKLIWKEGKAMIIKARNYINKDGLIAL